MISITKDGETKSLISYRKNEKVKYMTPHDEKMIKSDKYNGKFLSGVAKNYWIVKIKCIYKKYGMEYFDWTDVIRNCKEINRSDLTRLNHNGFIIKSDKYFAKGYNTTGSKNWRLNSDVVKIIERMDQE